MFGAIVEYARCNLMLYQNIQQSSRRIIKSLGCVDSSWNKFPSYSFHVATRLPDVKLYNWFFTHKGPGGWILVFSTCVILHGRLGKSAPGWGVCVCVNPSSSLAPAMLTVLHVISMQGVPEDWVKLAPTKAFTPSCDMKAERRFHVPAGLLVITCFSSRLSLFQV